MLVAAMLVATTGQAGWVDTQLEEADTALPGAGAYAGVSGSLLAVTFAGDGIAAL